MVFSDRPEGDHPRSVVTVRCDVFSRLFELDVEERGRGDAAVAMLLHLSRKVRWNSSSFLLTGKPWPKSIGVPQPLAIGAFQDLCGLGVVELRPLSRAAVGDRRHPDWGRYSINPHVLFCGDDATHRRLLAEVKPFVFPEDMVAWASARTRRLSVPVSRGGPVRRRRSAPHGAPPAAS